MRLRDRGCSGFLTPGDEGLVGYPRPEVSQIQVELAGYEGRQKIFRSRLVTSTIVGFDEPVRDEASVVVGNVAEVVAEAAPGDDGAVEGVPDDGRSEESVDGVAQEARGPIQAPKAGRADEN